MFIINCWCEEDFHSLLVSAQMKKKGRTTNFERKSSSVYKSVTFDTKLHPKHYNLVETKTDGFPRHAAALLEVCRMTSYDSNLGMDGF